MLLILAIVGVLYTRMLSSYATQVNLVPTNVAYFSNGDSLTLMCTVDQDVYISSVLFRRDTQAYVEIVDAAMSTCTPSKYITSDASNYSVKCDQQRNFTLIKKGNSAEDHRKNWQCILLSNTGGPCKGANNPCISPTVIAILQVPVTTVQLMTGSGQVLSSSVNIVRGLSTGIRCSTAPNGSRPRATFQWYIRQGNQSPVLIVDQSISPTPDPITVPGQESDILISYSTWTLTGNASYHNMYIYCQSRNETNTGNYVKSAEVQINIVYSPAVHLTSNLYAYNVTAYQSIYNVTEGMQNFLFTCNIIEANPQPQPNSYSWFHNTSIIPGQTSSSYTLPSVQRSDAGEYRCTARNDYGTGTSNSLDLNVQYGPTISHIGMIDLKEGETLNVTCNHSANPPPVIVWTRSGKVISNSAVLEIPSISRLYAGDYICTASNILYPTGQATITKTASETLIVNVLSIPKIFGISPSYKGYVGQYIMIQFDFYSNMDENLIVTAQHTNNSRLINKGIIRPALPDDLGDSPTVPTPDFRATLVISINNKNDFGRYDIEVKNSIGSDLKSVQIVEQITPEKPINFHVTNIQEKQLLLRWQSRYNGGFTQTFVVEISLDNITWNKVSEVSAGNRDGWFSTVIDDLVPGSEYYLRLYAYSIYGRGDFADVQLEVRTLKECAYATSLDIGASVGIGVGGAVLGLIAAIIAFTIRRQLSGPKSSCISSKRKTDEDIHPYSNTEMDPQTVKPIYEELNKGKTEQRVYDKISPL